MTTFLTIGRCELDEPPSTIDWSGDVLTLTGDICESTVAARLVRRHQRLGLVNNPDEDVFPVTFTEDANLDGFYTVLSVNVGSSETMLADGSMIPYTITLARVPGYANPSFETSALVTLRTNAHSITGTPDTIVGTYVYSHIGEVAGYDGATVDVFNSRAAETGQVGLITSAGVSAYPGSCSATQGCAPAHALDGACMVEVDRGGTYYPVVGRQVPSGAADNWRLSNGLVRVAPSSTSGELTFGVYNGSAWETFDFQVGYDNGAGAFTAGDVGVGFVSDPLEPTILHNSPEFCAIRFNASPTGAAGHVDISIYRGAMFVEVDVLGVSSQWGVAASSAAAATTTGATGGLRRTSNDANGNRWVFAIPAAHTADTTNGELYLTSAATQAHIMVGVELNGSSAGTLNTAADLMNQFYGCAVRSTRVVAK